MENMIEEKKKRFDITFGIIVAGIFGFLINILASIVYNYFFLVNPDPIRWDFFGLLLGALLISIVFLQFIVRDFKNELILNRSFFERFFDYYENEHWLSSRVIKVSQVFYLIFKWIIWLVFLIGSYRTSKLLAGIVVLITILFHAGIYWNKRKKKRIIHRDLNTLEGSGE